MIVVPWRKNVIWIWLSLFLAFAGYTQAYPVIPFFLEEHYHMNSPEERNFFIGLIAFAGNFGFLLLSPFWGRAADYFGRRKMIIRSNFSAMLLLPLMSLMPGPVSLAGIRFLIGAFGGVTVACMTLVACSTPEEHRGSAMGAVSSATFSGTLTGNVLGGLIAGSFGTSAAFWSAGLVLLPALLISVFLIREPVLPPHLGEKFSLPRPGIPRFGKFLGLMLLMAYMGIIQQLDGPFLPVLVKKVVGSDLSSALYWNGLLGGGAAAVGVVGGFVMGWCTDRFPGKWVALAIAFGGGVLLISQSICHSLPLLFAERMGMAFFVSAFSPVMQIWLSLTTPPAERGAFFGYAVSCRAIGWIAAGALGMLIGGCFDVRAVFLIGGVLALGMIPFLLIVNRTLPFPFAGRKGSCQTENPGVASGCSREIPSGK